MKKVLCLLLILAMVAIIPFQTVSAVAPPYELVKDQIVNTDEFFGYDANGNILTALPGVRCTCPGHNDGTQPYVPSDIVHDGAVNALDALYVLKSITRSISWEWWKEPGRANGKICNATAPLDVNGDRYVRAEDALEILKYAVGKIDEFQAKPSYNQPESPTDA